LPNTPFIDQLDQIYSPLRLRMRAKVGWRARGFSTDAYVNYTAGYENHLVNPVQDVGSYTTLDLRVGYDFDGTVAFLEGASASLEVLNVLDEDPTFVDIDGGADLTVASPLGRMLSLTLVKRW
jgi:iron complex outermembrane receptor protein